MRFDVRRFDVVTSTMDVCRALAEAGAPEGTVVLADRQTAGRGRAGRAWYSPPGTALYLSLLLRPTLPIARLSWITLIGGLAVADCVERLLDERALLSAHRVALKWPNDVLLDDRKIAGVLIETALGTAHAEHVIVGIGLNVNTTFEDAPNDVRTRATSLRASLGIAFDREHVLNALLEAFATHYARLPMSPVAAYRQRLTLLNAPVQLTVGGARLVGIARDVDEDGALVIQTTSGLRRVTHGEVLA
ncbi:MAG: biotin--[acetyl-CoA-carboxylase] ligase [Thermoflexales bacterium]|nr:biotin--[acetyl-CoA-carboxylase] ligase [Thermoflexales bacterium]MCS7324855.1 biotin--[acetyl-CoA-carboxylase] ligase [Thermoflexales bacterium]MDW8054949.1 biotin--[acetyl-CoA-carboxylase] ligase [Anaerolineae bacterium]MDW8293482.1 biotin--[acetyl-CoA-carboxylase] ligase [Anaerolineae bacterium]